jgi:hypothetical protein
MLSTMEDTAFDVSDATPETPAETGETPTVEVEAGATPSDGVVPPDDTAPGDDDDRHAQHRMKDMHQLIELMMTWYDDVKHLDPATLAQLMRMGSKVGKLLDFAQKLSLTSSDDSPRKP